MPMSVRGLYLTHTLIGKNEYLKCECRDAACGLSDCVPSTA